MKIIVPYLIEFAVQTAFLLAGLWIMIKFQKLNYKFLWLLGTAALTSGLEMLLDKFVGTFISTPIVVGVLVFCIMKITRADQVAVIFTVGVGYALMFCMNLWLIGTLMGDLRPSSYEAEKKDSQKHDEAVSRIPKQLQKPFAKVAALKTAITTRMEGQNAVTNSSTPAPRAVAADVTKNFSVKGVIRNGGNSSVVIHTGVKSYTLFLGDRVSMKTPKGDLAVRFEELVENRVVLDVNGEQVKMASIIVAHHGLDGQSSRSFQ